MMGKFCLNTVPSTSFLAILITTLLVLNGSPKWVVQAQMIPTKFDGFVYGEPIKFNPNNVLIEAFFDPVCPDTRDTWAPLKQVLHHYGSNKVSLIVHPFALPYHDNAFVTSRALHIVNELNSSATYPLWESFFKDQEKFYNKQTASMSKSLIIDHVVDFVARSVGDTYYSAVKSSFNNRETDLKTRISFKYGCTRGVFGTPFFFVNGFPLSDAGSAVDYNRWGKIIDPLVSSKREDSIQF